MKAGDLGAAGRGCPRRTAGEDLFRQVEWGEPCSGDKGSWEEVEAEHRYTDHTCVHFSPLEH